MNVIEVGGSILVRLFFPNIKKATWGQCTTLWKSLRRKSGAIAIRRLTIYNRLVDLYCALPQDHCYKECRLKWLMQQSRVLKRPDPLYPILRHLSQALLDEAYINPPRAGLVFWQASMYREAFDAAVSLSRSFKEWKSLCEAHPGPFVGNAAAVQKGYRHTNTADEAREFLLFLHLEQHADWADECFELLVARVETPAQLTFTKPVDK